MLTTAVAAEEAHRKWGWIFAAGAILAILGVVALMNYVNATLITATLVGFVLIVAGFVDIFASFTGSRDSGWWRVLRFLLGILYIVVGADIVANPVQGAITLIVVVGLLLLFDGIMKLITAFALPTGRWIAIAIGLLDILLGAWAITNIPYSVTTIGFFVGFLLLFAGINWMVLGWSAKNYSLP